MSDDTSRKRARLDEGEEAVEPTDDCTADAEFWFDDGNIILEAKGTQFKVYEGPLIAHSPFFRDMLSLPQPQGATAGNAPPLVKLPESPEDLRHFLRALMPSKEIRPFIPPQRPFNAVSACIRLGHKYQVDRLVEEGLKYLRTLYPDDFSTLEKRRDEEVPNAAYAISVVNIARLTGADYLLPVALAQCCQLRSDIVKGFRREDGTCEYLSTVDLGRCFQAKELLIEARVQAALSIFNGRPARDCLERDDDTMYLRQLQVDLPMGQVVPLCRGDVFRKWWPALSYCVPSLCRECDDMLARADTHKQRELFLRLPELVGVEMQEWRRKNRMPY